MTAARYRIAFEVERSAQGHWGSVLCVSGPLGLYKLSGDDMTWFLAWSNEAMMQRSDEAVGSRALHMYLLLLFSLYSLSSMVCHPSPSPSPLPLPLPLPSPSSRGESERSLGESNVPRQTMHLRWWSGPVQLPPERAVSAICFYLMTLTVQLPHQKAVCFFLKPSQTAFIRFDPSKVDSLSFLSYGLRYKLTFIFIQFNSGTRSQCVQPV